MYGNLEKELRHKKITDVAAATLIGCTPRTLDNKIKGITDFTLTEALVLHHNLLPEFEIDYIFANTKAAANGSQPTV